MGFIVAMDLSTKLIILGLVLNTAASIIMLWPYLSIKRNLDDDFIVDEDPSTGGYTQRKHIKDRRRGIAGFALFAFGFALQIIGVIL